MVDFAHIQKSLGQANITLDAMKEVQKEEILEQKAEQQESQSALLNQQEEAVNPFAAKFAAKQKPIKTNLSRVQKMQLGAEKGQRLLPIEKLKDFAQQFQQRNPEFKANVLVLLRQYIKPGDSKEEILKKVLEFYPDVSLADEALEFLLATTDGELARAVQEARDELNAQNEREITAGRNISTQAREASGKGLGTPTNLRDMYRDITGNPRDSTTLFQELSQRYAFKDLKKVVDFLLHSLGADMKSKGPSIPRAFLQRLLTETRSLQAILGVYRFFRGRMDLIQKLFEKEGLDMPQQLSFELLAKQFMGLAAERYPTADKVLQTAVKLGIEKSIQPKIIVLSQLRDAIREVAVNQIYKSIQHRDELYLAILEALEDLEDELDELLSKEDDDEIEHKGKEINEEKT